jgi:uncharacterized membrane protein
MADYEVLTTNDDLEGPRAWCHVMYGLHALSAVGGLLTSATIVGAFITGWPSILAVIINYATRSRVAASWLESHWRWQLRTFWFAVLWAAVALILFFSFFGIPLAWGLIVGTGLWVLYRVGRGWLVLLDRKAIA